MSSSYFGEKRKLLPILCQPDTLYPLLEIPENLHFIGIDSGLRHFVGGASYSDVRTAAFMGYSIIASRNGVILNKTNKFQLSYNAFYASKLNRDRAG